VVRDALPAFIVEIKAWRPVSRTDETKKVLLKTTDYRTLRATDILHTEISTYRGKRHQTQELEEKLNA
jgi:hypothetical protein